MKKIIFSDHAQERLKERRISETEVKKVLSEPNITAPTRRRRRKRAMKTLDGRAIDIIYEERTDMIFVITCAVLCKEG